MIARHCSICYVLPEISFSRSFASSAHARKAQTILSVPKRLRGTKQKHFPTRPTTSSAPIVPPVPASKASTSGTLAKSASSSPVASTDINRYAMHHNARKILPIRHAPSKLTEASVILKEHYGIYLPPREVLQALRAPRGSLEVNLGNAVLTLARRRAEVTANLTPGRKQASDAAHLTFHSLSQIFETGSLRVLNLPQSTSESMNLGLMRTRALKAMIGIAYNNHGMQKTVAMLEKLNLLNTAEDLEKR